MDVPLNFQSVAEIVGTLDLVLILRQGELSGQGQLEGWTAIRTQCESLIRIQSMSVVASSQTNVEERCRCAQTQSIDVPFPEDTVSRLYVCKSTHVGECAN